MPFKMSSAALIESASGAFGSLSFGASVAAVLGSGAVNVEAGVVSLRCQNRVDLLLCSHAVAAEIICHGAALRLEHGDQRQAKVIAPARQSADTSGAFREAV